MRIVITGASRCIGRASAFNLVRKHGARQVMLCDVAHLDEMAALAKELKGLGVDCRTMKADMARPDAPAKVVTAAAKAFGGIDAVIGNAGIAAPARLVDLDLATWDRVFNINTRANWLLGKAAYPHLRESRGSFVVIASMSGMIPQSPTGAYSPAKAALIMLAQLLAMEWAADGIRVNAVSPGFVHTSMTDAIYKQPKLARGRAALVPLKRIASPDDIANVVGFLVSAEANYITGQSLLVDGGLVQSILNHVPGIAATPKA